MFRFILGYASLAVLCAVFSGNAVEAGQGELAYAIFLRVNGRPITQENVTQIAHYLLKREYPDGAPSSETEALNLQNAAIRDLVRSSLIHSEASRLGLKVDRDMSRRAIAMSGLRPDEVTPTIRRILEADDLFEEIMMEEGTPIRQPTPREVRDFYLDHRQEFTMDAFIVVRTIFIGEDGIRPQSHFLAQAEALKRQLEMVPLDQRTEAFAKAARESSQDVFAEYGGLLTASSEEPWMPRDFSNESPDGRELFPQAMVQGIRSLRTKGEIRLAVSEDGVHLFYLEDLRGGNTLPWDEAKRVIEFLLKQRRRNDAMRNWINRIYDRSDVRWHDGSAYDKAQLTQILLPSERGMGGTGQ